jgi:hypothetical protein
MEPATLPGARPRNQRDVWAGLLFIAIGLGLGLGALNYKLGSSAEPGPGYFPLGLGALLALLGAVVLVRSRHAGADGGRIGRIAWRPLAIIVLAVLLFGFALPRLGLLLTMPLLIIVTGLAGDEFAWPEALLTAAFMTALSWLVFVVALSMPLPLWPTFISHGA